MTRVGPNGSSGSSSGTYSAQLSQTSTAATQQTAQAATTATRAAASMQRLSSAALALQSQLNAQSVANLNALNNVVNGSTIDLKTGQSTSSISSVAVTDGVGTGGLNPAGGAVAQSAQSSGSTTTTSYVVPTTATAGANAWVNVGSLTDAKQPGASTTDLVTVVQTAQQALLYWNSFNVGAHTELKFDQSAGGANVGDWVAINQIANSVAPSQILGSIQAPGQVYVINTNGIIFTGTSQVNTHTLVASSLPINSNLVATGLLNNSTDLSYLFSSLQSSTGTGLFTPPTATGSTSTATEVGAAAPGGGTVENVSTGGVVVEAGAQIQSPTTPEHVGGRVALIGPSVENDGTIYTPDGQTILAAGFQVGFTASTDPTLRGLNVYVGAATDSTGSYNANPLVQSGLFPTVGIAANGIALNDPLATGVPTTTGLYGQTASSLFGYIDAPRADVYMIGSNVQQNGFIDSSTSVTLDGRVDLVSAYDEETYTANNPSTNLATTYSLPTSTGSLTFGPNSITQILPEQTSDTIVPTQQFSPSIVNASGQNIDLRSGAMVLAPNATATFGAGSYGFSSENIPLLAYNMGSIIAEQGSAIDVSGSQDVGASVMENIVQVQLRGTELADSPVQQDGSLRGTTVTVDMSQYGTLNGVNWIGSPIGDLSGYADLIGHTAGELTANGGTLSLTAGTAVTVNPGATLDVSGGSIDYAGAFVQTSKVIYGNEILDISQANPNWVYTGLLQNSTVSSSKWGTSETFSNLNLTPQYDPGYVQGGNGGTLSVTAPSITLNGTLSGSTTAGVKQQQNQASLPTTFGTADGGLGTESTLLQSIYGAPTPSTLNVDFSTQEVVSGAVVRVPDTNVEVKFRPGPVTNSNPSASEFDLSTDLVALDDFGNLQIKNDFGTIVVPVDAPLVMPTGGSLNFYASGINVQANLSSPGGTLDLSATSNLEVSSALDVSGLVLDASSPSSVGMNLPHYLNGGSVTLQSYNLMLDPGSSINVSGGLYVSPSTKFTYGSAGAITLNGAEDLIDSQDSVTPEQSTFLLDATLKGNSGLRSGAGKLSIQAPLIQIGGASLVNGGTTANSLLLPSSFFSQGGFGTFTLTGVGDSANASQASVLVAPGTDLNQPEVQSWSAAWNGNQYSLATTLLPLQSLRAPVSISLIAPGVTQVGGSALAVRGNLVIGQNAIISLAADPSSNVTLSGDSLSSVGAAGLSTNGLGTIAVLGQIDVPGGTIYLEANGASKDIFNGGSYTTTPFTTVDLGPNSILNASGTTETTSNNYGQHTGTVLNGGNITVIGNIYAEQGAQILVNGAADSLAVNSGSTTLGLRVTNAAASSYVDVPVYSNGGSITLQGKEALITEATLAGRPGGASAQGGSLTVSSGSFTSLAENNAGSTQTPNDATLVLTNSATTYDSSGIVESTTTGAIGTAMITDPADVGQGILITDPLTDAGNKTIYGYFSAQDFTGSGLASLSLNPKGVLVVASAGGNINLTASGSITLAGGGVLLLDDPTKNTTVSLTAPYLDMGDYFTPAQQQAQQSDTDANGNPQSPHIYTANNQPDFILPEAGKGELDLNASTLVDVGTLTLQGFDKIEINQNPLLSAGDVRGAGVLELQGDIDIRAAQVYPATEAIFTIAAYSGEIAITGTGQLPALPYSAGGTLNLFANSITQNGVLRAPMGVINLGATASTPADVLSGINFDTASSIVLGATSVTSVSLLDPTTGTALIVPYGTNENGTDWYDPAGNDITFEANGTLANSTLGIPLKQIFINGTSITDNGPTPNGAPGAVIDVQGGGDLYSARWVIGTGGTEDILNTNNTGSFAIIPGYGAAYAPLDPTPGYSATTSSSATSLKVGDTIYLSGGDGLSAGYYTLLPAEFSLLPGGYLVTKTSSAPVLAGSAPAAVESNGSIQMTGYKYNGLAFTGNPQASAPSLDSTFVVESGSVVHSLAEYDNFYANAFLAQSAVAANQSVPRLPLDAGQLVFNATTTLGLYGSGTIQTSSSSGGLGGLVDIGSNSAIDIIDTAADATSANALVLLTSQLNGLNAASLLIGGTRGTDGKTVTVGTGDLEVNDNGSALTGEDLILVSNGTLDIDSGSIISTPASNRSITPLPLIIDGEGALVRVSSGQNGSVTRNVATNNRTVSLNIADAQILAEGSTAANPLSVGTLVLDSTGSFGLDSGASLSSVLSGNTLTFTASQINVLFPDSADSGAPANLPGLILTQDQIQTLQKSISNLDFQSYSSIDLYGAGTLGTDASGTTVLQNLSLSASQIRGYYNIAANTPVAGNTGITLSALDSVSLENGLPLQIAPVGTNPTSNQQVASLTVTAPTLNLGGGTGNNSLGVYGFGEVNVTASKEILAQSSVVANQSTSTAPAQATFDVLGGGLSLSTPLMTSQTGANLEILAGNDTTQAYNNITITSTGTLDPTLEQGLGGSLLVKGANIADSATIVLPSGRVTLDAASGGVTMGGSINVGGTAPIYNGNITEYTNGGTVTLKAGNGNIDLTGGTVNVSAQSGVGITAANAGSLTLQTSGSLIVDHTTTLLGQGGFVTNSLNGPVVSQGQNGSFSLDAGSTNLTDEPGSTTIQASDLGILSTLLSPASGDFSQSQSFRIRNGDVQISASNAATASSFNLSADNGNIDIYGTIDASGVTGGQVDLEASGNVTLHGNSLVTVAGRRFADSGQGGSVTLQGGSYNGSVDSTATVTIAPTATVDLTVGGGSTVQLSQTASNVTLTNPGTVTLPSGLSASTSVTAAGSGGYVLTSTGIRTSFSAGATLSNLPSGAEVIFTGNNGSLTLASGSAPVLVPSGAAFSTGSNVQLQTSGASALAFPPGASITLPQGTPGNDQVILYGTGTVTVPGGTATAFTSGATSLPAGTVIQFASSVANTNAAIAFANGGTGGAITIALASTDTLTAPVVWGNTTVTGNATGTLSLVVPASNFNSTGIVAQGTIISPSSILLEGNQVYGNTDPNTAESVTINSTLESTIANDAQIVNTSWNSLIPTIVTGTNANLTNLTTSGYGAEVVNANGNLVLTNVWDLSSLSTAGITGDLTLRASGNIILQGNANGSLGASLTDGFTSAPSTPWLATTLVGVRSWSFNLAAGADLTAANQQAVNTGQGSLLVGYGGPTETVDEASDGDASATQNASTTQATTASTQKIFTAYYQTIRTGTGNIAISTGGDVQLMNALANIYTAGQQLTPSETTSVLSSSYSDFALPDLTPGVTSTKTTLGNLPEAKPYTPQYTWGGGNVTILADGNIEHVDQNGVADDSSRELPTNWLDRRGFESNGVFADNRSKGTASGSNTTIKQGGIASTTWWVDFSNFNDGIAALGGGNITLVAGGSVNNVDASVATNARMVGQNSSKAGIAPNLGNLVELGGGDLVVQAGDDIDGGVYYVERGTGALDAGYKIMTNSTRATVDASNDGTLLSTSNSSTWLPTSLFVGNASFSVSAGNDLDLGSVVNPFLLPQDIGNSYLLKSYFSTYATSDVVNVASLTGNVTVQGSNTTGDGTIGGWYESVLGFVSSSNANGWSFYQPWLGLTETDPSLFTTAYSLMPPTLQVVAFSDNAQGTSGNIDLVGNLTLSPSPTGNLDLVAANAISGLSYDTEATVSVYTTIDVSDASPSNLPGVASPDSLDALASRNGNNWAVTPSVTATLAPFYPFTTLDSLFAETGSTDNLLLQTKEALHGTITDSAGNAEPLHYGDTTPVQIDAGTGDISGFTLYSPKVTDIVAGRDLTDIGLYLQNTASDDISVVAAGRDLIAYDAASSLRLGLEAADGLTSGQILAPQTGDIQIAGPGTLEVFAGQNFNTGDSSGSGGTSFTPGLGLGLTSIGNSLNPALPFAGADLVAGAGLGLTAGLDHSNLDFPAFIDDFLTTGSAEGSTYLPDLATLLGLSGSNYAAVQSAFDLLPVGRQDAYALTIFYDALRDAGRQHNLNGTDYTTGYQAINDLFPGPDDSRSSGSTNTWPYTGSITLTSREIKTTNGGNISLLAPGGVLTVGLPVNDSSAALQGVFTVDGGNISIFARNNVNVGVSRIFTLDGGNEIIWSSLGDIAAGSSSKTVASAPPTQVIVDPQSGNVETDLGGLSTGGGIGVLQTVVGAAASDVDLIAPNGFIDAGDAGIRASGNINVAAVQILNANNISAGGKTSGTPTTSTPNVSATSAASSAAGSATQSSLGTTPNRNNEPQAPTVLPSIITVDVLGYGGGDGDNN